MIHTEYAIKAFNCLVFSLQGEFFKIFLEEF
jgi:hypothetical protein